MPEIIKLSPRDGAEPERRSSPPARPARSEVGLNANLESKHFFAIGGALLTLVLTFWLGFIVGRGSAPTMIGGVRVDPEALQNQQNTAPEAPGTAGGGGGDPEATSKPAAVPGADD